MKNLSQEMVCPLSRKISSSVESRFRNRFQLSRYAVLVACLLSLFAAGCSKKETGGPIADTKAQSVKQLYQCPMHSNVVSDHPGDCPICGMELQPIKHVEAKGIAGRSAVQLTETQQQLINIRVAPVEHTDASRTIRAVGSITYDETKVADLNSKVKGWVRKLYVDKPGQPVQAGESLLTLYSPDLYSAQQEYLLAYEKTHRPAKSSGLSAEMRRFSATNNQADQSLLESARKRLELWDISEVQIKALEEAGTPKDTLDLTAPMTGVVVEKNIVSSQMITPGMPLYRIANLSDVWLEAEVYESELPVVEEGQKADVTVDAYPDTAFEGEVAFIYPYLQNKTRTAKVCLVLKNPDALLKPGMYANVTLEAGLGEQLTVPASAVFDTGKRQYVFIQAEKGIFAPKEVQLGGRSGERTVISKGLNGDELVVVDGNFLLDSESQMKAAVNGSAMEMPMPKTSGQHL